MASIYIDSKVCIQGKGEIRQLLFDYVHRYLLLPHVLIIIDILAVFGKNGVYHTKKV